ncbi:GntR family transcriptional regulator [Vibrio breoganii]|uniref:GntR family transcriptional regulator n=1 Tax=Vibrio breoganii TaxID=553239 RepID=UPI000C823B0A|nr:GntR family transcriptional regulator [Vibrio breoganii]PMF74289.1 GntR family transcriptional regulator [Vibrio breoganii]PMH15903.1 GntR family transcriptional regulator [Vibrio breoganii]PMM13074.1 GntR family transcriptional regulator [Vibrio breoganii]TKG20319.1 GntR family transcriptional regulator [Vibrio breoganii]
MANDEKVYQKILKAIVEHKLEPGVRLPEDKLSEAFGISRTGIRKVLQRLALESFVVIQPNKGAHVNNPSKQEAEDVLRSRIMLEPLLVKDILANWDEQSSCRFRAMVSEEKKAEQRKDLASSIQLTARFHFELAKQSGNSVLASFIEQLCYRSSLIIAAYGSRSSVSCDCGDHSELLDLLDNNQAEQAIHWMTHHLEMIKSSLNLESSQSQSINFQQLFANMD